MSVGPNIADPSGNLMDQNQNGTGGEPGDAFEVNLSYNISQTVFTSNAVVSETNTTYDGQDIVIEGRDRRHRRPTFLQFCPAPLRRRPDSFGMHHDSDARS